MANNFAVYGKHARSFDNRAESHNYILSYIKLYKIWYHSIIPFDVACDIFIETPGFYLMIFLTVSLCEGMSINLFPKMQHVNATCSGYIQIKLI